MTASFAAWPLALTEVLGFRDGNKGPLCPASYLGKDQIAQSSLPFALFKKKKSKRRITELKPEIKFEPPNNCLALRGREQGPRDPSSGSGPQSIHAHKTHRLWGSRPLLPASLRNVLSYLIFLTALL